MTNTRNNLRLAYITAASHSGSTMLAMLLNSHDDICTAGELKLSNLGDLKNYRCSCREIIEDCEFWSGIVSAIRTNGNEFELSDAGTHLGDMPSDYVQRLLNPLHRGALLEFIRDAGLGISPTWRRHFGDWKQRNLNLVGAISSISNSKVVVDSSKISVRAKYLLRENRLDTRIVRLIRDGRGVALTYMDALNFADARDPELRGGGTGKRIPKDLPMREAAREWRRSNEEAEELLATLRPDQWIQIRYEDLCRDVDGVLRQVTDFLGLAPGTNYNRFKEVTHHVVRNGMRLDGSSKVVLDERWRDVLTGQHLAEFDEVAGELNRSYGYA